MSKSTDPTGFEELDEYIKHLRSKGRKETTLYNNRAILRSILSDLKDNGMGWKAADIGEDEIFWMEEFYADDHSEVSRQVYERMLSRFVNHFTGRDPAREADILHNDDTGSGNVYFITMDQFVELYRNGDRTDRLILILGAYMGLRRAEIAGIREEDIRDGQMIVRGKGHGKNGKVSKLDIPPRVMREISDYRQYKAEYSKGCTWTHLVEAPKMNSRMEPLSIAAIGKRMNNLKHVTGIEFSTHSLRRLFATTLYYEAGTDLITIKNLMRHCKYETTVSRYIAPLKKKEREASERLMSVFDEAFGEI